MHYLRLIKAHEMFYSAKGESRAPYYDEYMKCKDWNLWQGSVPLTEVMKLFGFVLSWDPHLEGDVAKFRAIYENIYPNLSQLEQESIIDIDLSDPKTVDVVNVVFDEVAHCPRSTRYESTDASKILQTLLPQLFVMWDDKIKVRTLGPKVRTFGRNAGKPTRYDGIDYAQRFLPLMQQEARDALDTFVEANGGDRLQAEAEISRSTGGKSLAKLIDEFNYTSYTLGMSV
ncbi:MAG: hypothetical protein HYX93_04045 [Chloroflexi bacterium]|nr:hypothetical protein [Chloroflexota bacterium]